MLPFKHSDDYDDDDDDVVVVAVVVVAKGANKGLREVSLKRIHNANNNNNNQQ